MSRKDSPSPLAARLQLELLENREVPAQIYALNAAGRLLTFDSSNPSIIESAVTIGGLVAGEKITEIDVRPNSGALYGLSNLGRFYFITPFDGLATQVGTAVAAPAAHIGTAFNPISEQLQVVSNAGANIAINPLLASVAAGGVPLSYVPGDVEQGLPPRITALAFTNSTPLAANTALYGIDHLHNTLAIFTGTLESGTLQTIGSLGFAITANVGFAIQPGTNVAFATLQPRGVSYSEFCEINLNTGAATVLGPVGTNRLISDIAIAPANAVVSSTVSFAPSNTAPVLGPGISTSISNTPLVLGPGISTPFFSDQPVATTSVATAPLFPSLSQPLAAGTFAPSFSTFPTAIDSTLGMPLNSIAIPGP